MRRGPSARKASRSLLAYAGILAVVGIFIFPFLTMITTSFKLPTDVFTLPPALLPETWTFENFGLALEAMPIDRYLWNTIVVASLSVIGTLVSCPLVAYALAKFEWRGRGVVFFIVLATMMLPPQVTMIPLYLVFDTVGLTGTIWPLVLPTFFGTPFFIFLMRQFMMNVPDDLIAAARLDGASEFRIYWSIVLPLAKPALATIGIFQFMWAWTDFLNPLIYLNDEANYTLSLGLYNFFSENGIAWGPLMAASVVFTVPALIVFLIGQRFFLSGLATSGLK
ncbi:carbohydrate ABC transporter permease [Mycetocola miduiensis]|uniref:carbohydrate ABC transporter permease n=1 Tax=Mycetocola miduiensis TaxID=995034 RepID=UPI001FE6A684|nr:carbohydrate ABC transporter permease [Mycetocola miduiensis]